MYHHTQTGWVTLGATLLILPVVAFGWAQGDSAPATIGLVAVALMALFFGTLTIDIDDARLLIRFGIGLVRKTIALNKIRAYASVRNPWYYGWGIRVMPHGTLYNVSGLSAVELLLDNGRRVRVGTDEPQALVRALEVATRVPPVGSVEGFPIDHRWRRRRRLVGATIAVVVVGWVTWTFYVNLQPPASVITSDGFAVSSGWYRREIPGSDITSVELVDDLPRILRRTNGFATGGTLRGNFRLEEWGSGQLYINRGVPPYVVVRTRQSFVIVNFKEPERTRGLYESLRRLAQSPKPKAQSLECKSHETTPL